MNTRHVALQSFVHVVGLVLLILGSTVWVTHLLPGGAGRSPSAMALSDAALVIGTGIALLAGIRGYRAIQGATGAVLVAIALQQWLAHGWPPPLGALTAQPLGLAGLAAVLGVQQTGTRRITALLGLAILVMGALSMAALWHPVLSGWRLGDALPSATIDLLVMLLGGALMALAAAPVGRGDILPRRLLAAAALGAGVCSAGWVGLWLHDHQLTIEKSDALLQDTASRLVSTMDRHVSLLRRMADRWNASGELPSDALWEAEAGSYLRDFPSIEIVAILDPDRQVHAVRLKGSSSAQRLTDMLAGPEIQHWLDTLPRQAPRLSPVGQPDDKTHSLIAAPLNAPALQDWMLLAVLDARVLLRDHLGEVSDGFAVHVRREGTTLFAGDRGAQALPAHVIGTTDVFVHRNVVWELATYREPYQGLPRGLLADATLLTGLAFLVVLLVSLRLGALARRDAGHVAVQRDTMALIAQSDDLGTVLRAICAMAEQREPDAVCAFHALSADGAWLELASAPSLDVQATAALRRLPTPAAGEPRGEGVGAAVLPGLDAGWRAWGEEAIAARDGTVFGAVTLYVQNQEPFGLEQRQLLKSVAQFAALAFERVRYRVQLRASEQRYRSLFTFNPDAVFSLDLQGRFTTANPAGQRLLQTPETALVGRHFRDYVPPADMPHLQTLFGQTTEGEPQHFTVRGPNRAGEQIEVDVTTVPIAVDNAFVGVFCIVKDMTERRLIERALQERNQFFLLSPEMFSTLDADGRLLQVNPAFTRVTGYPAADLVGRRFIELIHEDDRASVHTAGRRLRNGTPIYDLDIRGRHRDGHVIWLRFRAALGSDKAVYLASREITEEVRVSRDLARKERSFRQLLDDNRDALLVVSPEGEATYANPAARELLGASLAGPAATLAGMVERRGISGGLFEWTLQGADGMPVEVEVLSAKTDWDGRTMHLLSLRDVRLRKASEKELRLLKRALQASHNAVMIIDARDPAGPLTYVNAAFERITGYPASESLGRGIEFLYGPLTEQEAVLDIRQKLRVHREVHVVMRNYRKDGSIFWADLYVAPVRDSHGRVTHYIGIQRDVSDAKETEARLAHTANHDTLTGLPNRRLLEQRLAEGARSPTQIGVGMALVFFDLDGFKPINDSMGHAVGDLILIEVAKRMRHHVRPHDIVARLSGDEFVMVLFDLTAEHAERITQRVITSISQPFELEEGWQHITASAGVTFTQTPVEDPMSLVQQADLAMYKAKHEGRNNFQWHTEDMSHGVRERVRMRNDLQTALETSGLRLHYQPKFDRISGQVVGIEALARWHHPVRGEVPPGEFIPVAEETGQIIALGAWALETACAHNQWLRDQKLSDFRVAVNISPMQFHRRHFVRDLQATLARTGLPAEFLELEITEGVLLDTAEQAIATLHQLKSLGVGVSIDDFGTGFSSLSYLKSLPIDSVKIDRSFVRDVNDDSNDAAIAKAIISMAHNLGLRVVAEGVETTEQMEFLGRNRCDEFQGFLLARPMPLEALVRFLERMGSLN